jgi:hypothetical protein
MNRKKNALVALVLLCTGLMAYADVKVTITAPSVTFNTGTAELDTELNKLFSVTTGTTFKDTITAMETETEELLKPYSNQDQMALGFANANVASAQSATMQGYQGYKIFAVTTGLMVGGQLPTLDTSVLTGLLEEMEKDPDLYVGAAPSVAFLNVGVNAGKLVGIFNPDVGDKLKNLYFNVKFGVVSYTYAMNNSSIVMNTGNFGFGVNYQLLAHSPSILGGLFMWRGINLATGINYQTNAISYDTTFGTVKQTYSTDVSYATYTKTVKAVLSVVPEVSLGINVSTFSIPLEASTSAQLLWLANVNLGIGADLAFGSSSITATGKSPIKIDSITLDDNSILGDSTVTDGSVAIDASTTGIAPSLFRPRISGGLGLNLGPVKVDVPVYYYFNYGFAAGLSLGFVW